MVLHHSFIYLYIEPMNKSDISDQIQVNLNTIFEIENQIRDIIWCMMDEFNHTSSIMKQYFGRIIPLSNRLKEKVDKTYSLFRLICEMDDINVEDGFSSIQIHFIPNEGLHLRKSEFESHRDFELALQNRKCHLETVLKNHGKIILDLCSLLCVNRNNLFALTCISNHLVKCVLVIQSVWSETAEITLFSTELLCQNILSLQTKQELPELNWDGDATVINWGNS